METLIALVSFAFVSSVTPGPNNLLLTASGLRFGFRATIPHILGIQFGMAIQISLCAVGIGTLLMEVPLAGNLIRAGGTAYLLYLAWGLLNTRVGGGQKTGDKGRPFHFWEATMFQFINPKAWLMSITVGSLFVPELDSKVASVMTLCLIFAMVGMPSSGSWALIGAAVKRYLEDPFWLRCFSIVMALLTVFAAWSIWQV